MIDANKNCFYRKLKQITRQRSCFMREHYIIIIYYEQGCQSLYNNNIHLFPAVVIVCIKKLSGIEFIKKF